MSDSLKAANKALIDRVRQQLSSDERFAAFRSDSVDFQRGAISAAVYHEHMVSEGQACLQCEVFLIG